MPKEAERFCRIDDVCLKAMAELWGSLGEKSVSSFTGSSMWPLIKAGDQVLIDHRSREFSCGDVVVFNNPGGLVAHRIVRKVFYDGGVLFLTKGDKNRHFDNPPLSAEAVLGKISRVRRKGKEYSYTSSSWCLLNKAAAFLSYVSGKIYALWGEI